VVLDNLYWIVVNWNLPQDTIACVHSLFAAGAEPGRVIIVDNGSTDDSLAQLQQAFGARIWLIPSPTNLGFAGGNNLGLAAAQGRYLLLLNSDAEVMPGALAALVAFMDAHPDAGACGPMLVNPDGSLQPTGRDLPTLGSLFLDMTKLYKLGKRDLYAQRGRDYAQAVTVGELSAAAFLVRRSAYEQVGGLDTGFFFYYEDVDWCKRIGDAGYQIYYVPTAQVMHHWQGTSRSVSTLTYRAGQDSLRYYFRKHYGAIAGAAAQAMLAGKESVLLVASALRSNQAGVLLHRQMLRRALAPLETAAAVPPLIVEEAP